MSYLIESAAFRESLKAEDTKQFFGCIITQGRRKIVAAGHNFRSFDNNQSCCCHAEMDAIYHHMKSLKRWRAFRSLLDVGRKMTGTLSRIPGKASYF